MKKLVIVVALIGATFLTTEANAFWFFRCRYCYPSRACSTEANASTTATPSGDLRPRLIPDNDASCNSCPSGSSQGRLINPVEPGEYLPTPSDLSAIERELVDEANRVRGRFLSCDAACQRRARFNAQCQAGRCQLGHFSGDSNEIAGVGYGSARAAIQGWLNSPAHRAILLRSNYAKVGASVQRGRDGRLYWSMNFGY